MAAFDTILVPEDFMGIRPIQRAGTNPDGTPKTKAAFDGAHGFGSKLWADFMGDYQKLIPLR